MKKTVLAVVVCVVLCGQVCAARMIENRNIPDAYTVDGKKLVLNGAGIRKKLFIKVYIGALYQPARATSADTVVSAGYPAAVKMHFLYSKVDAQKIVETFAEGFANNSPGMTADKTQKFLSIFTFSLVTDDALDLVIRDKNTVEVIRNGKPAGAAAAENLGAAVLSIFLGPDPADKGMKAGMLGQ